MGSKERGHVEAGLRAQEVHRKQWGERSFRESLGGAASWVSFTDTFLWPLEACITRKHQKPSNYIVLVDSIMHRLSWLGLNWNHVFYIIKNTLKIYSDWNYLSCVFTPR